MNVASFIVRVARRRRLSALGLAAVGVLAVAGLCGGGCGSSSDGGGSGGCGQHCPGGSGPGASGGGGTGQGGGGADTGGGGMAGGAGGGGTGGIGGAGGAGGAGGSYNTNLAVCWREPACHRALVIAHGGDWDTVNRPFLSRSAFDQAVADGANGIEADVRVTLDQVPMIAHSSPIETYESLDCSGQLIEQMTAAELAQCHLAPSFSEHFQRLDDVLDWANGKLIMELDVKLTGDLGPTIDTILARGAESRTTILVGTGEISNDIPTLPGWQSLYYIADIGDPAEIPAMLAIAASNHIFLLEIDRTYSGYTEAQVTDLIINTVNPGGLKAFGASDTYLATVQNHKDVYHQGFDVVLSYDVPNGVQAAAEINVERGYPP